MMAERPEGDGELEASIGIFDHLREGSVADAHRKLDECEEVPELLPGEEPDPLQLKLLLHLPIEVLDLPAQEVGGDDVLGVLGLHATHEDAHGRRLRRMLVDNEREVPSLSWHVHLVDARREVLDRLQNAGASLHEMPVLPQANEEAEFASAESREQPPTVIATIEDPDALPTDPLHHTVDDTESRLVERLSFCIVHLHHDWLVQDGNAVEVVPHAGCLRAPIEDAGDPFHLLCMGLGDVPKVVGDDGVLLHCGECAEEAFLHRRRNIDVLEVTAVAFRLFHHPRSCSSVEMVQDGGVVSEKTGEDLLRCPRLGEREILRNGAEGVADRVVDMLRRTHGHMGEEQYAEAFGPPFAVKGVSSLLDCCLLALWSDELRIHLTKNGCFLVTLFLTKCAMRAFLQS